MKKYICLLFILFIITGCEATYTIDIDNDFYEHLMVVPKNNDELSQLRESRYVYPAYYDEDDYEADAYELTDEIDYDDEDDDEDDSYFEDLTIPFDDSDDTTDTTVKRYNVSVTDRLNYFYTFKEDYQDSYIANFSSGDFTAINSTSDTSYSSISASDFSPIFDEYSDLDKITINIKTNKTVISNDADKVNGNIYTWVISKKNPGRRINIVYTDDRYYTETEVTYDFEDFTNSILNILNSSSNPDTDDESDLEEGETAYNGLDPDNGGGIVDPDNGGGTENPDNGGGTINPNNNNSNSNSDNTKNNSNSNVVLYVLYTLFFGLIFGIIIFRTFKNNIKIRK